MRAKHWFLAAMTLLGWLGASAVAQQAVRWQPTLQMARQLAAQSNRLVLVHFWAPSCGACVKMEQEVFSRPDVAAALEANYVAVKLNADYFPNTARQYGVTALPTDLVLTPQGQGQVVDKVVGAKPPAEYIAAVNGIAGNARAGMRTYAQIPGGAMPPGAAPPAAPPPGAPPSFAAFEQPNYGRPSPGPAYAGPQYADYSGRQQGSFNPADNPAPAMAPYSPPYAGPYQAPPSRAMQPDPRGAPLGFAASPYPNNAAPAGPAPGYAAPPSGYAGISAAPPNLGQTARPGPSSMQPGTSVQASASVPPVSAIQLPPGMPPLGLDGYCPVSLREKGRWVVGNRRWGAFHQGRTYLFAGPEEQQRFLKTPDPYAPVMAGNDVVLMIAQGQVTPGQRKFGAWYNDRVYLFSSEASFQEFYRNASRYSAAVLQSMAPATGPTYR